MLSLIHALGRSACHYMAFRLAGIVIGVRKILYVLSLSIDACFSSEFDCAYIVLSRYNIPITSRFVAKMLCVSFLFAQ